MLRSRYLKDDRRTHLTFKLKPKEQVKKPISFWTNFANHFIAPLLGGKFCLHYNGNKKCFINRGKSNAWYVSRDQMLASHTGFVRWHWYILYTLLKQYMYEHMHVHRHKMNLSTNRRRWHKQIICKLKIIVISFTS